MSYNTLALDENWDLHVDAQGDIALNSAALAIAQDVATACRTVQGEHVFFPSLGIPLFDEVMGSAIGINYAQHLINEAAKTIPEVIQAKTILIENKQGSRNYNGVITFNSTVGEVQLTI